MIGGVNSSLLGSTDKPANSGANSTSDCDKDNLGGWCLVSSLLPLQPMFSAKVNRAWDVDSDNLAELNYY